MEKTGQKKYFGAVGRRKTAVARVRIYEASSPSITINGKELDAYFPTEKLRLVVRASLKESAMTSGWSISAVVRGGGQNSQAEALRHGTARAIVLYDTQMRKKLKHAGFLKRDPRAKERRKFGLKKARKAPQWSKR